MSDTFACPHCGLQHSIHEKRCELTGQAIEAPPQPSPSTESAEPTRQEPSFDQAQTHTQVSGAEASSDPFGNSDPFADASGSDVRPSVSILGVETELVAGRPVMIGRQSLDLPNAGTLPDNVSSRHATIRTDSSGTVYLCDCGSDGRGSTNGTYVNGVRLAPNIETRVGPDDRIQLGQDPATPVGIRLS